MFNDRIKSGTVGVLGKEQCGDRSGRDVLISFFVMRQLCETFFVYVWGSEGSAGKNT